MHVVNPGYELKFPPRGKKFSADALAACSMLVDGLMLFLPGVIIYLFYVGWSEARYPAYLAIAAALSMLTVTVFHLSRLYSLEAIARPLRHLRRIVPMMALVLLVFIGFMFALKLSDRLSRVWVFAWFFSSAGLLVAGRLVVSQFLVQAARAGSLACNIIIVGGGEHGRSLINHLESLDNPWNNIVGVFDDRLERTGPDVAGRPMLGNLQDLVAYARKNRCDEILVALPWSAEQRVMEIIGKLRVLPVHVSLGPDLAGLRLLPTGFRECAGVPVLEVMRKPITGLEAFLKRSEDFILGSFFTLISLPVMLGIAILIKLDSRGPILFRQPRYGFNHKLINVYKFRTMYADKTDARGSQLTQKNDPRITRIGRFLRRSSLDELPQFFNVMKGEMSIVGPRPHAVEAKAGALLYEEVVADYAARHRVKPGITGWAQVNGWRGETETDTQILKRVEHDLHYIDNWSLSLDLLIILRTITTVLRADKAM